MGKSPQTHPHTPAHPKPHPAHPKAAASPTAHGKWVVVSEKAHTITVFEGGKAVKTITDFLTGGIKDGTPHYTPQGNFRVYNRDKDHVSHSYKLKDGSWAPMPNYVQFATGVGFHQGAPSVTSHGCVHLTEADSKWMFDWTKGFDTKPVHVWVQKMDHAAP